MRCDGERLLASARILKRYGKTDRERLHTDLSAD